MRYKVIITTTKLETAEKIYNLISKSKVHDSQEYCSLHPIKECCDECESK